MTRDFKIEPTVNGQPVAVRNEISVVSVVHGSDSAVVRPNAPVVIWVGTVQPDNWTDNDIWHDLSV